MRFLAIVQLFCLTFAFSQVKEIVKMEEGITKDLINTKTETLVIFDIDNTLVRPVQRLGSDEWFRREVTRDSFNGKPDKAKTLNKWRQIQSKTDVKLVEPGKTDRLIRLLQENPKIRILGLTARPADLAQVTQRQLEKDATIKLGDRRTTLLNMEVNLNDKQDFNDKIRFLNGVLFVGENDKGPALLKLLQMANYHPKQIVFFDDRKENIDNVEEFLNKSKMDGLEGHVSFWYKFTKEDVDNYNKDAKMQRTSDVQLERFRILSDAEAEKLQ